MVIPMQTGWNVERYFDPVYHASMPLEWNELSGVMDDINAVCNTAFPKWKRSLICLTPVGFILFVVGAFMTVSTFGREKHGNEYDGFFEDGWEKHGWEKHGFDGPNPISYLCIALGMLLFIGGALSQLLCIGDSGGMSDIRRKLSELNARYAQRGIDFQLQESRHLEYYSRGSSGSHRSGARTVMTYALVVQALATAGANHIPAPDVIASQALQMHRPTAPLVQSEAVE